jgi:hypothetical protein
MRHQRDEGALVGLQRLAAEGAQAVARLAVLVAHGREALGVELDPGRRVLRAGVLPGGEPQQHQALVLLAGLLNQGVDEAEVEAPFLGFHLFPGHRHQHGVGLEVARRRPHRAERGRVVAGVVRLRAEDQEGLAVDQQGVAAVALDQARRLAGLGQSGADQQAQEQGTEHGKGLDGARDAGRVQTRPAKTVPRWAGHARAPECDAPGAGWIRSCSWPAACSGVRWRTRPAPSCRCAAASTAC